MAIFNTLKMLNIYYCVKPLIPRRIQILLRRQVVLAKMPSCMHKWPVAEEAGKPPVNWSGWPAGKRFALVLTHDVDTVQGQEKCLPLVKLERELGFRSAFNFVIKNDVSPGLRFYLAENGFEVGVHGLVHDRSLYESREAFRRQAIIINRFLAEWGAVGFRSPSMYHNLEWIHDLDIEYDASTFDTDPFEPQPDGVGTIFPFFVGGDGSGNGYMELPYTLPQDFTLFILLQERDIRVWKRKLDWIAEKGGMALLNTHPDYMRFAGTGKACEEYPVKYYLEFLDYAKSRYGDSFWHALPREVAMFRRKHYKEVPAAKVGLTANGSGAHFAGSW